jgi:hypothetical protein
MSEMSTDRLIEALAAEAQPVRPLAPPAARALTTLVALVLAGAALVLWRGDLAGLSARYAGREALMLAEMAAMLATALAAVTGAFFLAVPGRSRGWLLAPLPPFAAWLALSGVGCWQDVARLGRAGWGLGHGGECLLFILAASLAVGTPLLWRLSRARPIDALPVALLGGLGAAALAALLLQFFHPFGLTALDLGLHFGAVLAVAALSALSRRRTLAPA